MECLTPRPLEDSQLLSQKIISSFMEHKSSWTFSQGPGSGPLLSQMNPVFTFTDYFFNLYHMEIQDLNPCTAELPMQNLTLGFKNSMLLWCTASWTAYKL